VHVDKVFDFKLKDGDAPVDDALMDAQGNVDENKLMERSKKNQEKMIKPNQPPTKKKSISE